MSQTTLRVDAEVRDRVTRLVDQTHRSANDVLVAALEAYEDRIFWSTYDQAVGEGIDEDPDVRLWDRTLIDALGDGPRAG